MTYSMLYISECRKVNEDDRLGLVIDFTKVGVGLFLKDSFADKTLRYVCAYVPKLSINDHIVLYILYL